MNFFINTAFMKIILLFILGLVATGCVTPEQFSSAHSSTPNSGEPNLAASGFAHGIEDKVLAAYCVEERQCIDGNDVTKCKILKPGSECLLDEGFELTQVSTPILSYRRFQYIKETIIQQPISIGPEDIGAARRFLVALFSSNPGDLWRSPYHIGTDPRIAFSDVYIPGTTTASLLDIGIIVKRFNNSADRREQLPALDLGARFNFQRGKDRIVIGEIKTMSSCQQSGNRNCESSLGIAYECVQVAALGFNEIVTPDSDAIGSEPQRSCRGILQSLTQITDNYFGD